MRIHTRQKRGARWQAQRIDHESVPECATLLPDAVQVGRLNQLVADAKTTTLVQYQGCFCFDKLAPIFEGPRRAICCLSLFPLCLRKPNFHQTSGSGRPVAGHLVLCSSAFARPEHGSRSFRTDPARQRLENTHH
jgi:hypothetical protein